MVNEVKIIPEELHLFHVDIIESEIIDSGEQKTGEFNLGLAHTIMHNLKDQRIKIGLHIKLNPKNVGAKEKAHFIIDFHFQIMNLTNFYKLNEENRPVFSGLLIASLLGLSFSTARGIIFERLSNTSLQGIILPVIDPKSMLQHSVKSNS